MSYDQILDIHFFYIFVHNKSFLDISTEHEHYNERFLDCYFRGFSAAFSFL